MIKTILNYLRIAIIFIWTAILSLLTFVLLLITWSPNFVLKLVPRKLWTPVLFGVSGIKTKVSGLENIDYSKYYVYVANHESYMDIPAITKVIPVPLYFMLKQELKKVPFLGWYAWSLGMIFVDRKNKDKAQESLKQAGKMIKKGRNVIVFPEGSRSRDGKMQRFKRGAFIIAKGSSIGLIPIAVKGSRQVLKQGEIIIKPGEIKIKVGTPIPSSVVDSMDVNELVSYTQEKIQDLYNSIS